MLNKILVFIMHTAMAVALLVVITVITKIWRENRREEEKLVLVPKMLTSAYPPMGQCLEVTDAGNSMYLYYVDGERKASRTKPTELSCKKESSQSLTSNSSSAPENNSIEAFLPELSNSINETLPMRIDGDTTLDTTYVTSGTKLNYTYTLHGGAQIIMTREQFEKSTAPSIRARACNTGKKMLDAGITIINSYRGEDGKLIGEIEISPDSCS